MQPAPVIRDPRFAGEDSRASSIEERCQELGIAAQRTAMVSVAFAHLCSLDDVKPFQKHPGQYWLKVHDLTNGLVGVRFIPRRDSDEQDGLGGRTKFGVEIEYRVDATTTQVVRYAISQ